MSKQSNNALHLFLATIVLVFPYLVIADQPFDPDDFDQDGAPDCEQCVQVAEQRAATGCEACSHMCPNLSAFEACASGIEHNYQVEYAGCYVSSPANIECPEMQDDICGSCADLPDYGDGPSGDTRPWWRKIIEWLL
jgi:hypothetical protein